MSLYDCSNSYFSDSGYKSGDFVLSKVSAEDLKRNNITMKLKDFKQLVKRSSKYKIIITGGCLNYRRTRVYNFKDFKQV